MGAIRTKRVYDAPDSSDGYRVLIDRVWPRGISRERALLDEWARELAPSAMLRRCRPDHEVAMQSWDLLTMGAAGFEPATSRV
jgi:uncharacterized protein YeaO (DUF488 family)